MSQLLYEIIPNSTRIIPSELHASYRAADYNVLALGNSYGQQ